MNNDKYKTIFWCMFKLNRDSAGKYICDFSIDTIWLNRQKEKVNSGKQPVLLLIPDLFCELVYDLKLAKKEINDFCERVGKRLDVDCISESKAVELFWNTPDFQKTYCCWLEKSYPVKMLNEEKKKRLVLYNLNKYYIDNKVLETYALRALAAFGAERQLEEKII